MSAWEALMRKQQADWLASLTPEQLSQQVETYGLDPRQFGRMDDWYAAISPVLHARINVLREAVGLPKIPYPTSLAKAG